MRIRVNSDGEVLLFHYADTELIDTIELIEYPQDLELGCLQGRYRYIGSQIIEVSLPSPEQEDGVDTGTP